MKMMETSDPRYKRRLCREIRNVLNDYPGAAVYYQSDFFNYRVERIRFSRGHIVFKSHISNECIRADDVSRFVDGFGDSICASRSL
jgi:hypothetical protein